MIAQTLHGYDQGHRLLARGGDVSERELVLLDRLSDLSGYLPLDTSFDRYHTGFPCGRYYAFACTWYDTAATRAGTVLTHTLLIPRAWLGTIGDLWQLGAHHRRPASALEREPYTAAVPVAAPGSVPDGATAAAALAPERAEAAIVLWFGQSDRPVLWVEDARPDGVVRFLWSLLWAEARERFAFCTFALGVRQVEGRAFDFLALPPAARGSFHERARSAAWWQDGRITHAPLRAVGQQPWVQAVLARGAEVPQAMARFCAQQGLPQVDAPALQVFLRFQELAPLAREGLAAARGRADLMARLWPKLDPEHALARAVLGDLLARQGEAPLAPRPLWELRDFVERPAVLSLWERDAGFGAEVEAVLARELGRRLGEAEEALGELIAWRRSDVTGRPQKALLAGICAWLHAGGESVTARAPRLLADAADVDDVELAQCILAALAETDRVGRLQEAAATVDAERRGLLGACAVSVGQELGHPELAASGWGLQGDVLEGLRAATRITLTHPETPFDRLEALVQAAAADDRLTWALEAEDPRLAWRAASVAGAAAAELGTPWEELVARCRQAPNGVRVLVTRAMSFGTWELRELVKSAETPTLELLKAALDPAGPGSASVIDATAAILPAEILLGLDVAAALDVAGTTPAARRLAEAVAPHLASRIAGARCTPDAAAAWLRARSVQEAIARAYHSTLFSGARGLAAPWTWLPPMVRAIRQHCEQDRGPVRGWIPALLELPLEEASAGSLSSAAEDLSFILALPLDGDDRGRLAAAVLHAVRLTRALQVHRLVEQTFPVVYPRLLDDGASRWPVPLRRFAFSWDVAKDWRHWLLDTWIEYRWPPRGLLLALGRDEDLFRRIAHRAAKRSAGRELLVRLADSVEVDAELARWRWAVRDKLRDLRIESDYD